MSEEATYCPHCGYDLRAAVPGAACPECGNVPPDASTVWWAREAGGESVAGGRAWRHNAAFIVPLGLLFGSVLLVPYFVYAPCIAGPLGMIATIIIAVRMSLPPRRGMSGAWQVRATSAGIGGRFRFGPVDLVPWTPDLRVRLWHGRAGNHGPELWNVDVGPDRWHRFGTILHVGFRDREPAEQFANRVADHIEAKAGVDPDRLAKDDPLLTIHTDETRDGREVVVTRTR